MAQDTKRMSLVELIDKVRQAAPLLDDKAGDILARNPELVQTQLNSKGQPVAGYQLGRILAIGIMDFLCWAFDRPDLGYLPPSQRGDET